MFYAATIGAAVVLSVLNLCVNYLRLIRSVSSQVFVRYATSSQVLVYKLILISPGLCPDEPCVDEH